MKRTNGINSSNISTNYNDRYKAENLSRCTHIALDNPVTSSSLNPTSVHQLVDKRGKLELDVALNWEPVEFTE